MADIFFISDTHFDHENMLTFLDDDDQLIRGDRFHDVEEMNETIIQNWNAVVKPGDKVYHLGDVTFKVNRLARIMSRLNGNKRLLLGNHDDGRNFDLLRWFEKVGIWRIFKDENFICTHVPIREDQFRYKVEYNVHGHTHQNVIGGRYINVCVEHTNYAPVSMDALRALCRRAT